MFEETGCRRPRALVNVADVWLRPSHALPRHVTCREKQREPRVVCSLWSSGGGTRRLTHDRVAVPRDATLRGGFALSAEEGEGSGLRRHVTGQGVSREDAERGVPEEATVVGLTEHRQLSSEAMDHFYRLRPPRRWRDPARQHSAAHMTLVGPRLPSVLEK